MRPSARAPPARRERLSGRLGSPYLVPLAAAAVAALGVWLWRDRLWAIGRQATGSPETQIREALSHQDRAHLEDVYAFRGGGTLELRPVRYAEVVTEVAGERATVVAMLEAEGRAAWRDQAAQVRYLGRERFGMRPCSIALWCADGDQFGRLRGVLALLFRRLDALERRDAGLYRQLLSPAWRDGVAGPAQAAAAVEEELARPAAGRRRVVAWQIRVERETAEVGEDYLVEPERGGPERLRARLSLRLEGGRWLLSAGR